MANGKGSTRRQAQIPDDELTANWKRVFGERARERDESAGKPIQPETMADEEAQADLPVVAGCIRDRGPNPG